MTKKFDAVAFMREARERLEREWQDKSREEQIRQLKEKYGHLTTGKRRRTG